MLTSPLPLSLNPIMCCHMQHLQHFPYENMNVICFNPFSCRAISETAFYFFQAPENNNAGVGAASAVQKAEDVVSSMLAKGFVLGKDAVNKAKAFDEKHQLISSATAKVASLDQKIGLSEKINIGATIVNDRVKEVDQKFQVSEKTKSAFAAAEQTVSTAGSAIMKNRYILTGTSWVTGAFSRVSKAAGEVGQKTMEKMAEEEHAKNASEGYAQVHSSNSPKADTSDKKTSSPKGLIL